MPFPWSLALKAIPWATILANAPALARAADVLLSNTRARGPSFADSAEFQNLASRIESLENHDKADAELLKQIADQIATLTTATEVLGARQRWLLAFAILSVALAVVALVAAIWNQ